MTNQPFERFSNCFLETMTNQNDKSITCQDNSFCEISKQEILKCWTTNKPFIYQDYRTNGSDFFIQAFADGREYLVKMIIPPHAIYANDIEYKKIKSLEKAHNGLLYLKIYKSDSINTANKCPRCPTSDHLADKI